MARAKASYAFQAT